VYTDHPVATAISSTFFPVAAHSATIRSRSPGSGLLCPLALLFPLPLSVIVGFILTTLLVSFFLRYLYSRGRLRFLHEGFLNAAHAHHKPYAATTLRLPDHITGTAGRMREPPGI